MMGGRRLALALLAGLALAGRVGADGIRVTADQNFVRPGNAISVWIEVDIPCGYPMRGQGEEYQPGETPMVHVSVDRTDGVPAGRLTSLQLDYAEWLDVGRPFQANNIRTLIPRGTVDPRGRARAHLRYDERPDATAGQVIISASRTLGGPGGASGAGYRDHLTIAVTGGGVGQPATRPPY